MDNKYIIQISPVEKNRKLFLQAVDAFLDKDSSLPKILAVCEACSQHNLITMEDTRALNKAFVVLLGINKKSRITKEKKDKHWFENTLSFHEDKTRTDIT